VRNQENPWDVFKEVATISADQATRPMVGEGCSLLN
jgi:hypothetical protein